MTLTAFVAAAPPSLRALVLEGEPGIGKTILWDTATRAAAGDGATVLITRPAQAEARLSFAGLADLLSPVMKEAVAPLPPAQRRALEVALRWAEPEPGQADPLAVSLAVLAILTQQSERTRLVLAIDDVQWLDPASERVLSFALRRMTFASVRLIATCRIPSEAPRHLAPGILGVPEDRVHRIQLGPLDLDSLDLLVRGRLGAGLLRPTLLQLQRASAGNPLFALEIARAMLERGVRFAPRDLPVPEHLDELLAARLGKLPASTRDLLAAAALTSMPTVSLLSALGRRAGEVRKDIATAQAAGIVAEEGGHIRFTHPLLAGVVRQRLSPTRERQLHRRLATAVRDVEDRARHLAAARTRPHRETALILEQAAHVARARGAPESAADLFGASARLTPRRDAGSEQRRVILAARAWAASGDIVRAADLLESACAQLHAGSRRAEVLSALADFRMASGQLEEARRLWLEAAREGARRPEVVVASEHGLAGASWVLLRDLPAAGQHAARAMVAAERHGDGKLIARAASMVAFLDAVLGRGFRTDLWERAAHLEREATWPGTLDRPSHPLGVVLEWFDDLGRARSTLTALYDSARQSGDWSALPLLCHELGYVEWRTGDWEGAMTYAIEGERLALQTGQYAALTFVYYTKALVEAHRGEVEHARRDAEHGQRGARSEGAILTEMGCASVHGFLDLSLEDYPAAVARLAPLQGELAAAGVVEPALYRSLPELVEALIHLGDLARADGFLAPFLERAGRLDRVWALAAGLRCQALLHAASGDPSGAVQTLEAAIRQHTRLDEPFEAARTQLVFAEVLRRARRKREAREWAERADAVFTRLGAPIWAERARAEVRRASRRDLPDRERLTMTEEKVARLVAEGYRNRDVATALFMSPHTVEAHLKSVYRKLGLRSRTQLAHVAQRLGLDETPHA